MRAHIDSQTSDLCLPLTSLAMLQTLSLVFAPGRQSATSVWLLCYEYSSDRLVKHTRKIARARAISSHLYRVSTWDITVAASLVSTYPSPGIPIYHLAYSRYTALPNNM